MTMPTYPSRRSGKYNSLEGKFHPLHPGKCKSTCPVKYKSRLELRMMMYLDKNSSILFWKYEPIGIKYYDKFNKRERTYYVDFIAGVSSGGKVKIVLLEIKSKRETKPPNISERKTTKRYSEEYATWITNSSKWDAARKFAKTKGYEFLLLTEDQLV